MDENNNLNNSQGVNNENSQPEKVPSVPVKNNIEKSKQDKRMLALIITVGIITVIVLALIIIGIVKVTATKPVETVDSNVESVSVSEQISVNDNTDLSVSVTSGTVLPETSFEATTTPVQTTGQNVTETKAPSSAVVTKEETTVPQTTETETIEGLPPLEKTGDNILSDDPDNEYIKLVSENKKVDASVLVAIYTVPDEGNNFVLEFDGTKDSNGKIIKSPDTLLKVHQVDKNKKIKTATVNGLGNSGVGYAEGKLVFYMVTNIVMPQYPDYFTGIK